MNGFLSLKNGGAVPLDTLPEYDVFTFRTLLLQALQGTSRRISAFFTLPAVHSGHRLIAILLDPAEKTLLALSTVLHSSYPGLTPDCPAFHRFERELWEDTGILPEGHPWLKPVRFHARSDGSRPEPGVTDFFTLQGSAAHEVAVGPVHAGVIEPGHFRFQCMGETVHFLEIALGYQHRGIEKMLSGGPDKRTPHLWETAAGDSSIASATNGCRILEALTGQTVSPFDSAVRVIALELERIANHIGDLGALAGDVAFLPTASYCGRIRGDFLNMTAMLCGNRFGRNFIVPGGVRPHPGAACFAELLNRLNRGEEELENALSLMFDEPSVLDRFENTGTVSKEDARSAGLVGMAGRASGLTTDIRSDLPWTPEYSGFRPCSAQGGDVFSRALVRHLELKYSLGFVRQLLNDLPAETPVPAIPETPLPPDMLAVSLVEAWRGELCHAAVTGKDGRFLRYKIVDPSFHNWFGLALALRGEQISDFPICNKSFNLSYCGHDL